MLQPRRGWPFLSIPRKQTLQGTNYVDYVSQDDNRTPPLPSPGAKRRQQKTAE